MKTALSLVTTLILIFLSKPLAAQEINQYYIYGCENCVITEFQVVGQRKILFDYTKFTNRKMILLNHENLVVDEMRVGAPADIVTASADTFLVPDLGQTATISIANDKFVVESMSNFDAKFGDKHHIMYPIETHNFFIAQSSFWEKGDIPVFTYLSTDQSFDYLKRKWPNNEYRKKGKWVTTFSLKHPITKGPINEFVQSDFFINEDLSQLPRADYIPAWSQYDLQGNTLMVFSHYLQWLYWVDLSGKEPRVIRELKLPLGDNAKEGWIHYYDNARQTSYLVLDQNGLMEPSVGTVVKKKKKKKGEVVPEKKYTLYVVQKGELVELMPVKFKPLDIENGVVYEMKQDKKSYNIYGYPLFDEKEDLIKVFFTDEY